MRGMWPMPQRIQEQHIEPAQLRLRFRRNLTMIGKISHRTELESVHRAFSVQHADGSELEAEKFKRRLVHPPQIQLGDHGLNLFVERVAEHALERRQSVRGPIHWDGFALPEVERADVIQAKNVICVRVGVENRIRPAEPNAEHLLAEIGRGVHHHIVPFILQQDGRTQALIARIGRRAYVAGATDSGNAGTRARAKHGDPNARRAHSAADDVSGAGFGALSLACTKRNRSSVSEFSISLCSSRLKFPLVFSAIIASISMVWRAAGRFSSSSIPSPSFSRPNRISACILREKTRNSKVAGGIGIADSDMALYL